MRATKSLLACLMLGLAVPMLGISTPAGAQKPPARPAAATAAPARVNIGKFDDWSAATAIEAGKKTCYAYSNAKTSTPAIPGRETAVLTVTQRPAGRDQVALRPGFEYSGQATLAVLSDQTALDFFTAKRSAFARDGKAAVAAFQKGRQVTTRAPAPRVAEVTDMFSLKGFDRAYAAINKECPAK